MAHYRYLSPGTGLFYAYSFEPLAANLISHGPTSFTYRNADGSTTTATGSGFVFDGASGVFTAGAIASLVHRSAAGVAIDRLDGLTATAEYFQYYLEQAPLSPLHQPPIHDYLMPFDDTLDARGYGAMAGPGVTMDGGTGNDTILGSRLNDKLLGNYGNDRIEGGLGNDHIDGGQDKDALYGDAGNDRMLGRDGNDILKGGDGGDILSGGAGNDRLEGGASTDYAVLTGLSGDYHVTVLGNGALRVAGPDGVDALLGVERLAADDGIFAWNASRHEWVKLSDKPGQALLLPQTYKLGDGGANSIVGTDGEDTLDGGDGDDTIDGRLGGDLIFGRDGNDNLGGGGDEFGDLAHMDRIYGGAGDDTIAGGGGNDRLHGEAGDDVIDGGDSNDTLSGGLGADTFEFHQFYAPYGGSSEWGDDTVVDFVLGVDHLVLDYDARWTATLGSDGDGNAVIGLDLAGNSITLLGVSAAGHTLADFLA